MSRGLIIRLVEYFLAILPTYVYGFHTFRNEFDSWMDRGNAVLRFQYARYG
jgi:hypothetical protein